MNLGGKLTLATTGSYNNTTTGSVSGLMYTSSNPAVATRGRERGGDGTDRGQHHDHDHRPEQHADDDHGHRDGCGRDGVDATATTDGTPRSCGSGCGNGNAPAATGAAPVIFLSPRPLPFEGRGVYLTETMMFPRRPGVAIAHSPSLRGKGPGG